MKSKKLKKRRNIFAKSLSLSCFRQRIVPDLKKYRRKRKHKNLEEQFLI